MQKRNNIIISVVLLLLVGFILFQNHRIKTLGNALEEEKVKTEAEAYKSIIKERQLTREFHRAELDSINEVTDNKIFNLNRQLEKNNSKLIKQIKFIPTASNPVKDSIWISEMNKTETTILEYE